MTAVARRSGWSLALALALACNASPPLTALTDRDCPEGARVVGTGPPAGTLQRCELPGGIRHGTSRAWYDNGRLRYETEWWQGVKHGKFTIWYANGQKRAEGQDRHGIPEGRWVSWAEDGTLVQERNFRAVENAGAADRDPGPAR